MKYFVKDIFAFFVAFGAFFGINFDFDSFDPDAFRVEHFSADRELDDLYSILVHGKHTLKLVGNVAFPCFTNTSILAGSITKCF